MIAPNKFKLDPDRTQFGYDLMVAHNTLLLFWSNDS